MRMADCHPNKRHKARGLCHNCYMKLCYAKKPGTWRRRHIERTYGLTLNAWEAMLGGQVGCAICHQQCGPFHTDHDHKTGKVRGILCQSCNHGVGNFHDDPDLLEAAARYIRNAAKT